MKREVLKGQQWEIKLVSEKGRTEADIAQSSVWEGHTRNTIGVTAS